MFIGQVSSGIERCLFVDKRVLAIAVEVVVIFSIVSSRI